MKNPKVSVVLAVYNGEKTLMQCLSSLLRQTYKNYEVVAVNNNSTDSSAEMLEEYQKLSKIPFRIFFKKERSFAGPRNLGIINSAGEIVICADQDCIFYPDWIEKLTEPIRNGEEIAVQGGEEAAAKGFWTIEYQKSIEFGKSNGKYTFNIDSKNLAVLKNVLFGLENKGEIFNPRFYCEDLEFGTRFFLKGFRLRNLPECRVKHYHYNSFSDLLRKEMKRGYSATKIYFNIKNSALNKAPIFKSCRNPAVFLAFFPWHLHLWIAGKKAFSTMIYSMIQDFAWRLGVLTAYIDGKRIK